MKSYFYVIIDENDNQYKFKLGYSDDTYQTFKELNDTCRFFRIYQIHKVCNKDDHIYDSLVFFSHSSKKYRNKEIFWLDKTDWLIPFDVHQSYNFEDFPITYDEFLKLFSPIQEDFTFKQYYTLFNKYLNIYFEKIKNDTQLYYVDKMCHFPMPTDEQEFKSFVEKKIITQYEINKLREYIENNTPKE